MSSKTDEAENGCQPQSNEGEGDQGSPNTVVDLMAKSNPDIPPPQTPSKNVTADEAENGCQSQSHEGEGDQGSHKVVVDLMAEDPIPPQSSKNVPAAGRKILWIVAIELAFVFVVSAGFFFNKTDVFCSYAKNNKMISVVAMELWADILLYYTCWRLCFGVRSGPLLSLGNVIIFALTTLCLTGICVFLPVCCSDGLILIYALGSTLTVLLLILGAFVLTPLDTTRWGNKLTLLVIVFSLTVVFMILKSELMPGSNEVQIRSFTILLCVSVILIFIYSLNYLQTNFVKLNEKDGWLWLHPCIMLLWILILYVMLFLLFGLILHKRQWKSNYNQ